MNHNIVRIFITLILVVACNAATNPDKCVASPATQSAGLNWSTDDPKLSFLKKLQEYLEKIPLVKTVKFSGAVTGSIKFGEECCPGAKVPSKYTEYNGKGSASFALDFLGVGFHISPAIIIPIPYTGYDLIGELQAEAGVSGGGTLGASISAAGKDGDCDCFTITIEGAASPQVTGTVKGAAAVGYMDGDGVMHAIVLDVGATAGVTMTISLPKYKIPISGALCPKAGTPQICFKWPTFKFTTVLKIPIPLVPDVNYTFELDLLPLFGLPKESCIPK